MFLSIEYQFQEAYWPVSDILQEGCVDGGNSEITRTPLLPHISRLLGDPSQQEIFEKRWNTPHSESRGSHDMLEAVGHKLCTHSYVSRETGSTRRCEVRSYKSWHVVRKLVDYYWLTFPPNVKMERLICPSAISTDEREMKGSDISTKRMGIYFSLLIPIDSNWVNALFHTNFPLFIFFHSYSPFLRNLVFLFVD